MMPALIRLAGYCSFTHYEALSDEVNGLLREAAYHRMRISRDRWASPLARNEVMAHHHHLAARIAPELLPRTSAPKQRAWGMPGASTHPQPRVQSEKKHTSVVTAGPAGSPGIPARNGFNGFLRALPGDRAFLPPSPAKKASANLTPASGRQDHTTSPSAGWHVRQRTASVHRIPRPTFVTIAKRPSCGHETAGVLEMICPTAKAKYFFRRGWT
jgi:hypothetical protein